MKTKDLEILVKPYSSQGVTIRWVDDSTVLAVFRTPALGKTARSNSHILRLNVTDITLQLGEDLFLEADLFSGIIDIL